MPTAEAATLLLGRELETQCLGDLVDRVRDRGGAMLIRGEAGIGKSALLTETSRVASARGLRILTTRGVESEAHLPFAGLHELMRPILAGADELPAPQRDALRAAFGMTDAAAPDVFLIALAALNLLAEASVHSPVLVIVEDAQWLDRSSADVLAFVARRLESEPIVLLAAIRTGFESSLDDAGLPELPLDALDDDAAAALLDAHAPELAPAVRNRVLEEAAGNPLALVELPVAAERQTEQGVLPPALLPLTTRLERAFAARVPSLPAATRTLLLVGALNDGEGLSETLGAASIVLGERLTMDDLTPAIAVRLVDVDEARLRFRHPLMRSAIHQGSSIAERHAAHAALASVLPMDGDRRVWHRAASTPGPDESVASELEATATRAQRCGGIVAAVAALERAATLSEDPARQAERLLRAAELAVELGQHDAVGRLARAAAGLALSSQQRARLVWIRGGFDDGIRDDTAAARSVAELAEQVAAAGDTDLALKLLWHIALRSFWNNSDREARERITAAAERLAIDEREARLLAILAFAAPIERGAVVIERVGQVANVEGDTARLLGDAALLVGAFDLAARLSAASLADLRAQGRLGLLVRALAVQAYSSAQLVDLSVAIPAAEEASRLAHETSQPVLRATGRSTEAILAALRGDQDRMEALAAEAEQGSLPVGARPVLAAVQHARGLAALGDGRHSDAYEHLRRMHDPADPAYHFALRCWAVGDLAEAAVHSGHGETIRAIVEEMETLALETPSPSLHAGLRHARALLADGVDETERLFAAALQADTSGWPFVRARAQLAYGAWLRRQRRAADSRGPLRAARETFDALGAIPWSDRARQELRASGETSRRRAPEARDRLTPQELQIAQMAAEGLSNREIGQKLYLSHRTVGAHLYRIFPKLGITSRAQLRTSLEGAVVASA